jgi:tripartite-type tricarboxylate transporter receptor subunit TctC
MNKSKRNLFKLAIASLITSVIRPVFSELKWPQKTIRFVVPFVPGGTSDIVSRITAQELSKLLPYPVVVDNKAGGGGVPAMQDVAKSPPDGHTMILGHVGSLAVNPVIFPNAGYDVNKDFAPVTLLVKVPSLFVVHPDLPVKTVKELVTYAEKILAN